MDTANRLDLFTTENYHPSSALLRYCVAYGRDGRVQLEAGSRGHFRRDCETSPSPSSRVAAEESTRLLFCSFIYDAHVPSNSLSGFYSPTSRDINVVSLRRLPAGHSCPLHIVSLLKRIRIFKRGGEKGKKKKHRISWNQMKEPGKGRKERLGGPARWMLKTKANTERNSIALWEHFVFYSPFFCFVLFSSSSSSRQLSISITSLLLSFFFLHFFLLFCSILRWSSNNSARAIKAIFDQRLEEEMKIVDKTGCSQFYYVRRKSKLEKARENRNDIVPKWKKKRRELHRRKKKEKKKEPSKPFFLSFFLSRRQRRFRYTQNVRTGMISHTRSPFHILLFQLFTCGIQSKVGMFSSAPFFPFLRSIFLFPPRTQRNGSRCAAALLHDRFHDKLQFSFSFWVLHAHVVYTMWLLRLLAILWRITTA